MELETRTEPVAVHLQTGDTVLLSTADTSTVASVVVDTHKSEIEQKMQTHDRHGLGVTVIAMGVVLFALLFVCVVFLFLDWLQRNRASLLRLIRRKANTALPSLPKVEKPDAVCVAIALALDAYKREATDEESLLMTIQAVERKNSPWNSKFYGVMQGMEWSRMRRDHSNK